MKISWLLLCNVASFGMLGAFGFVSPTAQFRGKRIYIGSAPLKAVSIAIPSAEPIPDDSNFESLDVPGVQRNSIELVVLFLTVIVAAVTPAAVKGTEYQETLENLVVPSMTLIAALIGLLSEYTGKTAVCDSKEIAAIATAASAESEVNFAKGEKVCCALPLCLGLTTTTTVFSVILPYIFEGIATLTKTHVIKELYVVLPVISVVGGVTALLASEQTVSLCGQAIGVGERRFSSAKKVGRTWLSLSQQVKRSQSNNNKKYFQLGFASALGPFIAAVCPGPISFKCFLLCATTACQCAYYLAIAEFAVARCTDALALKMRSAATSDSYANQGTAEGSILPFTSALGGICTAGATTVGIFLSTDENLIVKTAVCAAFPTLASLLAAAASVSKVKCIASLDQAREAAIAIRFDDTRKKVEVNKVIAVSLGKITQIFRLQFERMQRRRRILAAKTA